MATRKLGLFRCRVERLDTSRALDDAAALSQFLSHSWSSAWVRAQPQMGALSTWRTGTTVPERGFAELESV